MSPVQVGLGFCFTIQSVRNVKLFLSWSFASCLDITVISRWLASVWVGGVPGLATPFPRPLGPIRLLLLHVSIALSQLSPPFRFVASDPLGSGLGTRWAFHLAILSLPVLGAYTGSATSLGWRRASFDPGVWLSSRLQRGDKDGRSQESSDQSGAGRGAGSVNQTDVHHCAHSFEDAALKSENWR